MSVSTLARRITYIGSAHVGESAFPVTFHWSYASEISASIVVSGVRTVMVLDQDPGGYSLSGTNNAGGGTLTLLGFVMDATQTLVIERLKSPLQLVDITNQGSVLPESVEGGLDALAEIHQQLEDLLGAFDDAKTRVLKLMWNHANGDATYNQYDARQNRISNLADATLAQDAVNLRQLGALSAGITATVLIVITTNPTITTQTLMIVDPVAAGGNVVISLPSAVAGTVGRIMNVKRITGGANTLTVKGAAATSDTIDDVPQATGISMPTQFQNFVFACYATGKWAIL